MTRAKHDLTVRVRDGTEVIDLRAWVREYLRQILILEGLWPSDAPPTREAA